jgi:hypothetical protein
MKILKLFHGGYRLEQMSAFSKIESQSNMEDRRYKYGMGRQAKTLDGLRLEVSV